MIAWLINRAQTSTALVAFIIGSSVIIGLQSSVIWRHFTTFLLAGCVAAALLLSLTNIKDTIILDLGEDTTLTGRTGLWAYLRQTSVNPIVGDGFESFWSEKRKEVMKQIPEFRFGPNQAHNGYLEMYLNLGALGLIALCAMVVSGYVKARRRMLAAGPDGERTSTEEDGIVQFTVAFLLAYLATNWTDAGFRSVNFVFLVFVALVFEYGPSPQGIVDPFAEPRQVNTPDSVPRFADAPVGSALERLRGLQSRRRSTGFRQDK
jgi:O-antigen ligase